VISLPDGPDLDAATDEQLEEERDFLLGSLTDLEAERSAGDVDDHDYESLRDGYTARAAAVLRALDRRRVDQEIGPAAESEDPLDQPGDRRAAPRWRRPVIAAVVAAFAVVAGLLVAHSSGQRLPGQTLTGTVPGQKEALLLATASSDAAKGDAIDAIKAYDQVLSTDPTNDEALAYRGWLLALAGQQADSAPLISAGMASIQQAETVDPSYPDAHFFGGMIDLQDRKDPTDAVTEFETYLADHPPSDMLPEVQGELQVAQAQLNHTPAPGETTGSPTSTVPAP
jgi:tetratricopeptide (TPR) repeat protein